MARTVSPSAVQASLDLRLAFGRLRRRMREVATGEELSAAQVSVLARLGKAEASSASALAALEGVRPQSMAATLASLAELGLVTRTPDATDGRRQIVELTDAGRDAESGHRRARGEWLARTLDDACTEAERQTLIAAAAILQRVAGQ
jgi:DNA-binding MarR family transcriptional regulator